MNKKTKRWMQGLAMTALLVGGIPLVTQAATNDTSPMSPIVPGMQMGAGPGSMMTTIAGLLKLSPDEMRTERLDGKSLEAIAKEQNTTSDKLLAEMMANRTLELNELVKAGTITSEQKEQYLSTMKDRMTQMIERTTTGRPDWAGQAQMGRGRGYGNGMHTPNSNFQRGYGQGMNGARNQ